MGTCHPPRRKNLSTYSLNMNTTNNQDLGKGGCNPQNHHHCNHNNHHNYHPYDNHVVGGVGVVVVGVVWVGE